MIERNPWGTFLRLMPYPDLPTTIPLSFVFQMIFAQTELSPPPPDVAAPGGTLFSSNLGWLVVTAFAVAVVFWIVRNLRRPIRAKSPAATSTKVSSVAPEDWKSDNLPPKEQRSSGKKTKSKKSKKAGQGKTLQRSQPSDSVDEVQSTKADVKMEPVNEPEPQVEPARAALVPITPIFEPLQQVGSLRRVSIPESEKGRTSVSDTEKAEVVRPLSVPFEKTKKTSYRGRVSENRWANFVSEESVEPIAVKKEAIQGHLTNESHSMPKTNTETISIPPEPVVRAPQGLKSFVSKIKSSNATTDK